MIHTKTDVIANVNPTTIDAASRQIADQAFTAPVANSYSPLWIGLVVITTLLITGIIGIVREIRIEADEARHKDARLY